MVDFFPNLESLYVSYSERLTISNELFASIKQRRPNLKVYVSGLPPLEGHTLPDDGLEALNALHNIFNEPI
jgi:hypothetical protein